MATTTSPKDTYEFISKHKVQRLIDFVSKLAERYDDE
jgi:hypothetical protein